MIARVIRIAEMGIEKSVEGIRYNLLIPQEEELVNDEGITVRQPKGFEYSLGVNLIGGALVSGGLGLLVGFVYSAGAGVMNEIVIPEIRKRRNNRYS